MFYYDSSNDSNNKDVINFNSNDSNVNNFKSDPGKKIIIKLMIKIVTKIN